MDFGVSDSRPYVAPTPRSKRSGKLKAPTIQQPRSEESRLRDEYAFYKREEKRQRRAGTDRWIKPFQLCLEIERYFQMRGKVL